MLTYAIIALCILAIVSTTIVLRDQILIKNLTTNPADYLHSVAELAKDKRDMQDQLTNLEKQIEANAAIHSRSLAAASRERDARNEELRKRLSALITNLSEVGVFRSHEFPNRYRIVVEFDPAIVGYGRYPREDLAILAEHIGHQVATEISRSKFAHAEIDRGRPIHPGTDVLCEDGSVRRF